MTSTNTPKTLAGKDPLKPQEEQTTSPAPQRARNKPVPDHWC